jgi:uncharacterized protein (TIGR03437 family)
MPRVRIYAAACLMVLLASTAAPAAEADALAISSRIMALHFPYSSVLDPIFDSASTTSMVGYTRCGDSAIWTGHFLAAEAFRYAVTHSSDALANARRAYTGLQYMVDVTGNNVLARCLVPANGQYAQGISNEEASNGIYTNSPGNIWVGNTSRDQYSGALFGLGAAYDLIDDPQLHSQIAALVSRMVQFLVDKAWNVVLPDGTITTTFLDRPDQQLAFLQLARHVNPSQFSTIYDAERLLLAVTVPAPVGYDTLSDNSYFKFNLDYINLYTLIHLESSSFGDLYNQAYSLLRDHTAGHLNAFFDIIDRALNGPNAARDAETRMLLDQWLLRSRRDFYVDNTGKFPTCGDPTVACNPIPVPNRVPTDFLWQRSPFQMSGGGSGLIESAGIDYILPYWMARYFNVVAPDNLRVVSAASDASPLASGEIASIFGTNLASTTQSSTTQPPPTSLGGVSVLVNGTAVPVYFVASGQINFVLPSPLTPGAASVVVHSGSSPDIIASATVQPVAPALFSADASGHGAAAATAIMVTPAGQSALPVISCTSSGCVTVPLKLGVDTPIYLTLYGTGIRNAPSLAAVTCTIGGVSVPVQYAGPQPQYAGLDQVNVPLTLNLRGLGEVDVIVTVSGQASNAVRVNVQ